VKPLIVWTVIGAVLVIVFNQLSTKGQNAGSQFSAMVTDLATCRAQLAAAQSAPQVASVPAKAQLAAVSVQSSGNGLEIVLHRALDSHFYVAGEIDSVPFAFQVDTGATTSSIPASLAQRVFRTLTPAGVAQTANGSARFSLGRSQTFRLGPAVFQDVGVAVLEDLHTPLLGQDLLSRFDIDQRGDVMTLTLR